MSDTLNSNIEKLIERIDRLIRVMERGEYGWLNPDEACRVLGFPIAKSRTHLRRLQWLRECGYLTKYRVGKPFMYDRRQVQEVAEQIREGKLHVPAPLSR